MGESTKPHDNEFWEVVLDGTQGQGKAEWRDIYVDRQRRELDLAELYARDFHHGTTGHNQLMLIGSLADLIDFILDKYTLVKK